MPSAPHIAILGANGLIGHALAVDLRRRGFAVRGYARHLTSAQKAALAEAVIVASPIALPQDAMAALLADADIVVNCIGVLQGAESEVVHHAFVARLAAVCAQSEKLLIHLSVPGETQDDCTAFSRTKRAGEQAIAASGTPFIILRPGFVVAKAAYGGSALIRALAALPLELPRRESDAVFAATAMGDICDTVALTVVWWRKGERGWAKTWDVMEQAPGTVGEVVGLFRSHNGGPRPLLRLPGWLLAPGIAAADAVALLGWRPSIRHTAIAEMRRGVTGDPHGWMAETGIVPLPAQVAVATTPATVQEKWFGRLYLLKALALTVLVAFWCVSGLIALTVSFEAACAILLAHGFSSELARDVTIASSLLDIGVGLVIAVRRFSHFGLAVGIIVSLGYMAGSALIAPELWIEPLGALVKTFPAIVLMLFCLAVVDDR
jgi:uncharacterized protein YbjT (DUF2867 family)